MAAPANRSDYAADAVSGTLTTSVFGPARLTLRSHRALITAPTTMWMTPLSGPSQRS